MGGTQTLGQEEQVRARGWGQILCDHGNGHCEDCGKMETVCNMLLHRKYGIHNAT